MKQGDKGGKRSADGVGESQHAGRWSGRATGDENSPRNLSQEKAQASQTRLGESATPPASPHAKPRASSVTHVTSSDFRLEKSRTSREEVLNQ